MNIATVIIGIYLVLIFLVVIEIYCNKEKQINKRTLIGKFSPLTIGLCAAFFLMFYSESFNLPKNVINVLTGSDVIIAFLTMILAIIMSGIDIYKKDFLFLKTFGKYVLISVLPYIAVMFLYNFVFPMLKKHL
jgi:hypothetical protein